MRSSVPRRLSCQNRPPTLRRLLRSTAGRAQGACARSDQERRRGVATLRRGGETPDQPHNRPVPTTINGMTLHVEGLRWHDPISVVGVPSHSYGYGVVAPPRSWSRGIRNAAHCTPQQPSGACRLGEPLTWKEGV